MPAQHIRVLALALIQNEDKILVYEGYDETKQQHFYRPLGGGVEFGEAAADALVREFREELGAEIQVGELLDVSENIFEYQGKTGHEVVFLFEAKFINPKYYEQTNVTAKDDHTDEFVASWKGRNDFDAQHPLVPEIISTYLKLAYAQSNIHGGTSYAYSTSLKAHF